MREIAESSKVFVPANTAKKAVSVIESGEAREILRMTTGKRSVLPISPGENHVFEEDSRGVRQDRPYARHLA